MEMSLWRNNDIRTHFATTNAFLRINNCKRSVPVPVWHVYPRSDQYFNNDTVEQHLRQVFSDYHGASVAMDSHVLSVVATKQETTRFIPQALRAYLRRKGA